MVRIPVVPGCDGRTFLTYVNAIVDQRAGAEWFTCRCSASPRSSIGRPLGFGPISDTKCEPSVATAATAISGRYIAW